MIPGEAPRIGLDLLVLASERTGMGQVAYWLARLLPRMAPDMTFVLFLPEGAEPPADGPNVEVVRVPTGRYRGARLVTEQWHLPRAAEGARLSLLHTLAFASPVLYEGTRVLTVHDLAYRHFPEAMPFHWRRYWNWAYGPAARGCRRIVAVSECTKNDLIRQAGFDPDRIAVVPNAVDEDFRPEAPGEDTRSELRDLKLPPRFILHVGTLQPRKDLVTLFKTFAQVRERHADIHLVVSGGRGWGYRDPAELARHEGIEGSVHFLGYTPSDVTRKLYRVAEILLFTSLYEGFGLPVLEAMRSGLPVVATSGSSVPEVTGDTALLAPPGDVGGLARHALSILEDRAARAELARRGLERSKLFSWERSAAKMLDVYRGLIPGGNVAPKGEPALPTNGERA